MIDTHAHIYMSQFKDDLEEVIASSISSGVDKIFMPNVDSATIELMYAVEEKYPEHTASMMGLHPCNVKSNYKEELDIVKHHLSKRKFIAVGEIGIDLYWDKTYYKEQVEAFRIQSEWAVEYKIPIVIHSRESIDIILNLLEEWQLEGLKGVFHCFGGSREQLERIRALGFMVGIGGVLTFKKSELRNTLHLSDLDMIVLETDAPYLTPAPHRGKRNQPSYIALIAKKLGEILDTSIKEIDTRTTENALNLFEMSHFY